MTSDPSPGSGPERRPEEERAEALFAEYLSRLEKGEKIDFESLCADHPEQVDDLRALLAGWWRLLEPSLGSSLAHGSIAQRIRDVHGSDVDPDVEIDSADSDQPDFSSKILRRLSDHAGGFGRYSIRGEIARGGQGAVLRVWDEDLHRKLAMKVILGSADTPSGETPYVDPKTLGRFLEEAQVTGQLDHPGIVPVHELGLDGEGRVYFTMKLVKGETLRDVFDKVQRVDDGWTRTRALGVLLKVCEAMAYAHDKGVVHRDLKPANVMVGRFGEVYVMDWGLARLMGREDKKDVRIKEAPTSQSVIRSERRDHASDSPDSPLVTMDGDVVGTPAYMSPEQAKGLLDLVGPPSDVYSVGAMLYHLFTGHMPYAPADRKANNYAVWHRVQEGPPRALRELTQDVPAELEAICEKAMAREIGQRYRDTSALGNDLGAYLEGRVVRAYETGGWAEARKWMRRNQGLAAALLTLFLVLIGASIVSSSLANEASNRAAEAQENYELARKMIVDEPEQVLEVIRTLMEREEDARSTIDLQPGFRNQAIHCFERLFELRGLRDATRGMLKKREANRLIVSYSFSDPDEGQDFEYDPALAEGLARFSPQRSMEPGQSRIGGGALRLSGLVCLSSIARYEPPMSLRCTVVNEGPGPAGALPAFLFGFCADDLGNFIVFTSTGQATVSDEPERYFQTAGPETGTLILDTPMELVARYDGKGQITCEVDGEITSQLAAGPRIGGRIFIATLTEAPVRITDLELSATISDGSLRELRQRYVLEGLEEMNLRQ